MLQSLFRRGPSRFSPSVTRPFGVHHSKLSDFWKSAILTEYMFFLMEGVVIRGIHSINVSLKKSGEFHAA